MQITGIKKKFRVPLLFMIYNRPQSTQLVFDVLKKIKPPEMYVAADGPKDNTENLLCRNTREIIKLVDWDCRLKKNYSDINLGCKNRVSSSIDWFFENVEQGIILEDDCVPSISFFYFCQELLDKYQDDHRIMHISGYNHFPGKAKKQSYYFSKYTGVWGWATWRRAWKLYDKDMKNFPLFMKNDIIKNIYKTKQEQLHRMDLLKKVYRGEIDTWDFQWDYTVRNNNGLCVRPTINLVTNIGFGKSATHTKRKNKRIDKNKAYEIEFPLKHPDFITIDEEKDREFFNKHLNPGKRNRLAYFFKKNGK